jgi:hypothetical protein
MTPSRSSGPPTPTASSKASDAGTKRWRQSTSASREHAKQCNTAHQACLNKAAGASPLQFVHDLDSEAEAFIARIDRVRLGLDRRVRLGHYRPLVTEPVRGSFRPIARNTNNENKVRYVTRMKFLADWSEFSKRRGVTRQQQLKIKLAFDSAQTSFQAAETRLARLAANYLIPIPSKGYWDGQRLDYIQLLKYTDLHLPFREYDRRMKAAEKALGEFRRLLGSRRANRYFESVWTNIYDFGFAAPMNPRQEDVGPLQTAR